LPAGSPAGARYDAAACCRWGPVRSCDAGGPVHRPGDADGPAAAAAVRAGHPQFLRPAPRQPVRLPGADAAGDRAVRRRHPALHRCAPAGAWSGSRRGQGKDQVAREYLAGHHGGECIVFAGVAREKNRVGRTAQRRDRATGKRYPWLCQQPAMAGHWHFYGFDADFGPFPITFCGYSRSPGRSTSTATKTPGSSAGRKASPSRAWITRSARSAARRRPRRICDGLTGQKIYRFAGTWLARLPQPFTRAGQDAGYRWPLPAGQVEFSATMAPDRPVSGRIFSRAADPRQPRHRPPGQGDHRLRPGHRPARQVRPPRDLPHPGHHHRHLPLPLPVRQEDPRRAVPQRRTGAPHQDHHQPAPRPRHRQGADQPRRPGHGRRHGQRRQIS